MKVTEPAADLAVAAALLSAREDTPLPADSVIFGEISLSAAIRPVNQTQSRLKEAKKLGFSQAIAPDSIKTGREDKEMIIRQMRDLPMFVAEVFGTG